VGALCAQRGVPFLGEPHRVRTGVRNGLLDRLQLGFGEVVPGRSRETRLISAILLPNDWRDRLCREVAADQEGVGVVERRGGEELPKGNLRAVEVRS